jgi:hypothetical protein
LLEGDRDIGERIAIYQLEGLTGTYDSMPAPFEDIMTPDHQPQASILVWSAEQWYFDDAANMQERGAPGAPHGYAINLYHTRHVAGRTYGRSKQEFVDTVEHEIDDSDDIIDMRNKVIELLEEELEADVRAMNVVANRPNSHPIWDDIHELDVSRDEKGRLINMIRQNILRGEQQLANQDLESLKY